MQSPTVFASSSPSAASVAQSFDGPAGVKNSPPFFPASDANKPIKIIYAVPSTSNWESCKSKSISDTRTITRPIISVRSATVSPSRESCRRISLNNPSNALLDSCPIVEPTRSLIAFSKSSTLNLSASFSNFVILRIRFRNRFSGLIT